MTAENAPPSKLPNDPNRRHILKRTGLALGAGALGMASLGAVSQETTGRKGGHGGRRPETESQQAFAELLELLGRVSRENFSHERDQRTALDIAEGQRLIAHLLSAGMEFYMDCDPERPAFIRILSPERKFYGDNPDAFYYFTQIDGSRSYRIRGRNRGEAYISYTLHTGNRGGNWSDESVGDINSEQFRSNADGSYELILSPERQPGNWVKTDARADSIITRHYFENARSAAADPEVSPVLEIEPLDGGGPGQLWDDAEIARRLREVTRFVSSNTIERPPRSPELVPSWWSLTPNRLGETVRWGDDKTGGGWGAPDNTYTAGVYAIEPGHALVMEGRMPRCIFANVMLWNRLLQTDDYRYRQVSLNRKQMDIGSDGRFRILIADRRPQGMRNWIDNAGRSSGIIQWRFLLAREQVEAPQIRHLPYHKAVGAMRRD